MVLNTSSSDYFLGLPNNIASYHMLQVLIASYLSVKTGILHKPRFLKATLGDVHIYKNHVDSCEELFNREPSTVAPSFVGSVKVIKHYLSDLNSLTNTITRTSLSKLMLDGIRDYNPGKVIKGARNV